MVVYTLTMASKQAGQKRTKPKCGGNGSTPCGYSCISAKYTCRSEIDLAVSKAALAILLPSKAGETPSAASAAADAKEKADSKARFAAFKAGRDAASATPEAAPAAAPVSEAVKAVPDAASAAAPTPATPADSKAALDSGYAAPDKPMDARAAKLAEGSTLTEQLSEGDFNSPPQAALTKVFSQLAPSLADKADDFIAATKLRAAQAFGNRMGQSFADESKKAAAIATAEDAIFGRKPSAKTADEYEVELLASSKAWGKQQGFGDPPEGEEFLEGHDMTHSALHMLYGGGSDAIHKSFGSIMTKDGKPSLAAEEGLAAVLESLARGGSLPAAIASGQSFSNTISKMDEPGSDAKASSSDFASKLAKFAVQAMASDDFSKIQQVIMKQHRLGEGESNG